ncbi:MAG: hypothetical protein C0408_02175 [Odoribacter sp.]|nr:hypothetical protein [Odoribacter sp.]
MVESIKFAVIIKIMTGFLKICGLSILGLCIIFVVIHVINPKLFNDSYEYLFTKIIKVKCIDYKQAAFSKKLNNKIPDYILKSALSGVAKCRNEQEILERVTGGKLVKVKSGNGFIVEEMSQSYSYLTPDAKDLLIEISKRFREKISNTKLKATKIKITSMTRTTEKLKRLREVNSNASANSPHLHGNAFDISYIRFSTRKLFLTYCDKKYLKEALAEVIWKLREEKKCWATYELKQYCFHVVSR